MKDKFTLKNTILFLISLLVIGGGVYGGYWYVNRDTNIPEENSEQQKEDKYPSLPEKFPREVINENLKLTNYTEAIEEDKKTIIVTFIPKPEFQLTLDQYRLWLEELGWKGIAAGSSYTEENGQTTVINHQKEDKTLVVDYHYPGRKEETNLENIILKLIIK